MRALFFGDPSEQLFGCYHPPAGDDRRASVLLCYPGPHEYMTTHWAFRRLAEELARQGFHVFRFDYFGCGDSAGAGDEGTLVRWTVDVRTAARELVDQSGAERLSVVGMRLGAALAIRATHDGLKVRDLVLWNPVVGGATYLDELKRADARSAIEQLWHPPPMQPGFVAELRGHPFSRTLWEETERLDLLQEPLPQATRVHLLTGKKAPPWDALAARYGELKRFSSEIVAEEAASRGNMLGARMQQAIVSTLARRKE